MHRLASRDDYGSGTFRYSKNESGGACHAANAPPDLRLEERLPLWWLVFVFFLGLVLLFRLLLLLTRRRLLTLRLRRALLLLLHRLRLLTRSRLLTLFRLRRALLLLLHLLRLLARRRLLTFRLRRALLLLLDRLRLLTRRRLLTFRLRRTLLLLLLHLLLLARRRLLALRLRRALLLLLHLLLLTRGRLLAPLLLICRPIVGRRAIWLRVGRRCIGAVACWCAVRLRVGRLRVRPVVVGARRSWAIIALIVWPVVVGRRRSRLIVHRRTVRLHVSWPLCVHRRRIRPIVLGGILRSIATFATRTRVVLRLIRPVTRIVLRLRRLRIRPVVVGARRSWAIVALIVWPVVVGRRRCRLIIHLRTVWLHVSWPLCVRRRRIRRIILRGIVRSIHRSAVPFATRTHVVLGLTRPVARIVLRFRRPRWGRHPHGCRNGFLLRFDLSRLGNGKRLPTILPDGNLLPFHRGWRGRWRSPCHYGAVFNPLGWVRRCWPPSSNKRLPLRRHGRSLHCDLRAGHLSLISPHNVPCHWL